MLGSGTILVVGNLKVGKSTIFSHLVGRRRQRTHLVDTPGFYSLQDRSEDAGLARKLLTGGQAGAALLVLDSKNLARGLKLFLELAEYDIPVTVALNMCDEARQRGVEVDVSRLSEILGVEVVPTVATEGRGLGQLRRALAGARRPKIELEHTKVTDEIRRLEAARVQAEQLASKVVTLRPAARTTWKERLEALSRKPASGIPIAVLVLFATYMFVGWFGAGILVDLLEGKLFGEAIIPWLEKVIGHIPWQWLRDLLVGPFGLLTVGLVLSLAIVLPVLATFFFAFALMEDSGYLPRLSLLTDRVLRKLGLNGKGVLPLVMGLSCVTMAVLSARVLDSPKQRIIATLLLVLTVPCAPLLAVMMVLLARLSIWATVVFFGLLLVQFFIVGALANLLIPGKRPDFVLELPPMHSLFPAGNLRPVSPRPVRDPGCAARGTAAGIGQAAGPARGERRRLLHDGGPPRGRRGAAGPAERRGNVRRRPGGCDPDGDDPDDPLHQLGAGHVQGARLPGVQRHSADSDRLFPAGRRADPFCLPLAGGAVLIWRLRHG
jgi:ferrous iron transport protein B